MRSAVFTLFLAAAANLALAQGAGSTGKDAKPSAPPTDPGQQLMNPGDEIDGNASAQRRSGKASDTGLPKGKGAASPATTSGGVDAAVSQRWGVVLVTFGDAGHEKVAAAARNRFAATYPECTDAYVRSTDHGSVVMVGHLENPTAPNSNAKEFLERIKAISPDGTSRPFARVYLSRVQTTPDASVGPYDLSRARKRFPKVNPLFTVQVAMWSDFDSKTLSMQEIESKADAYCRMLRMKSVDAYVKHDEDKRMSIVTIGAFDSSAYDSRSTLFSPEVERIFKQFPTMLVNGEELSQAPQRGSVPGTPMTKQTCTLIEIPR